MKPYAIFLIGSAGSGKSTIGKRLATEYNFCYLDKDMVCNIFTGMLLEAKGYSPHERDGNPFYSEVVMDAEYTTLLHIANDNLQLGRSVVLDAPFLGYFSKRDYIRQLTAKYGWEHVTPFVLEVHVDFDVLKQRMAARGLQRDQWKIDHWQTFVEGIQSKRCLWEEIEIISFDNSPEEFELSRLQKLLPFSG
ncbi:AAA family ATPase [Brevibacillus fulvus]|uniref:Kinase n=1 Tax=Brevibacillus fulvus TaxID=1125967 RepID=A0A939BNK4_9BACL|nr:ATP-binding protein [Brevibacillus fulvus]MBM7589200.1 putative kinase [Brevibacillus fulvus]